MCTYSITLSDNLVEKARQSFDSEQTMAEWLQQQVEALLAEFNASRQAVRSNARHAIEAMRRQSEQNGNSELSLDDINNEIHLARKAKRSDGQ